MMNQLSLEELYRHMIVFGTTGCGKTRFVLLPLLCDLLARDANNLEKRAGALILDVKGDMIEHIRAVMAAAGRTDPLLVIGRGGNCWVDPFMGQVTESRTVAERLMEITRSLHPGQHGGSYDDFWKENNRRLLQVATVLTRARHLGDLVGIQGISDELDTLIQLRGENTTDDDAITTENPKLIPEVLSMLDLAAGFGAISSADAKLARSYIEFDAVQLPPRTWATIVNYARSHLSCLTDSKLAQIFSPETGSTFCPDQIMDLGRVVVVSLSRVHYGPEAEVFRMLLKTAFQVSALQRHDRMHFDGETLRPVNCIRPVYFVGDEFPSIMTPGSGDEGDSFFLDKCRESRISCILTAQSVSALSARSPSQARVYHLLNNCATKVFMSCDCPETLAYFESACPLHDEDNRVPHPAALPPPMFRLPNYQFAPVTQWQTSANSEHTLSRQFTGADLRGLKTGEAILVRASKDAERTTFSPSFETALIGADQQNSLTSGDAGAEQMTHEI